MTGSRTGKQESAQYAHDPSAYREYSWESLTGTIPRQGTRARSGEQSGRPHTAAAHDAGSASGGSE